MDRIVASGSLQGLLARCAPVFWRRLPYVVIEDPSTSADAPTCRLGDVFDPILCREVELDLIHPVGSLLAAQWLAEHEIPFLHLLDLATWTHRQRASILRYVMTFDQVNSIPLWGLLSPWVSSTTMPFVRVGLGERPSPRAGLLSEGRGWLISLSNGESRRGPECGDEGKAACNAAILKAGYAYVEGDELVFPNHSKGHA